MASYEDTVVALGPVGFWRTDDLSGTVMTARLGTDGTYFTGGNIFGQFSPIETDAASRAIIGRVGRVNATGALDPRANFTWLVWAKCNTEQVPGHVIVRNGQNGLGNSNFILMGSHATVRIHLVGDPNQFDHVLSSPTLVNDVYYMVTITRNVSVLRMYINDTLVSEDTTLSSADIDPGGSTTWEFGSAVSGTAFFASGMDEPTIFDYPLSAAEVLEVYESAINQTLLRARSDVVPTAVLYSDFDPDPVSFPFRHNWESPLVERLTWRTGISRARSGLEEAIATRRAPRREYEFVQIFKNSDERRRFRHMLNVNQNNRWWIPVRQDAEFIGLPLTAGPVTIPVTTQLRDYLVGGYVHIRQLDRFGAVSHWEEVVIEGLTGGVQCQIGHDYTAGSMVQPVRKGYLNSSLQLKGHTNEVEECTVQARLLPEDESLNQLTTWTPTIKYRDYEVFDPSVWQANNWDEEREYEVSRAQEDVDFDIGVFEPETDTAGANETFSYRMLLSTREDIAALLGWFYERRGSQHYLWVPTMQRDWEPLNRRTTDLQVSDTIWSDHFAGLEHRKDLAFVYNDNSMQFRRIVGSRDDTPDEVLELDATVPTFTNLRTVSQLKFCRLDADSLEIAWHTDSKAVIAFRFYELLHVPEGTGVSSLSPSASISLSRSPSASVSPSPSESMSVSPSSSASASVSPSESVSPSSSNSPSESPSASESPSSSASPSYSPSGSESPSSSESPSVSPSSSASPST